ncbi:MAG: hypothetical protein ACREGI_03650 [Candidatus Levyibacteriota bacterium]
MTQLPFEAAQPTTRLLEASGPMLVAFAGKTVFNRPETPPQVDMRTGMPVATFTLHQASPQSSPSLVKFHVFGAGDHIMIADSTTDVLTQPPSIGSRVVGFSRGESGVAQSSVYVFNRQGPPTETGILSDRLDIQTGRTFAEDLSAQIARGSTDFPQDSINRLLLEEAYRTIQMNRHIIDAQELALSVSTVGTDFRLAGQTGRNSYFAISQMRQVSGESTEIPGTILRTLNINRRQEAPVFFIDNQGNPFILTETGSIRRLNPNEKDLIRDARRAAFITSLALGSFDQGLRTNDQRLEQTRLATVGRLERFVRRFSYRGNEIRAVLL